MDKDSGVVHTIEVTGANTHNVTMVPKLLTGEEEVVYGDSGYLGAEKREDAVTVNAAGKRIKYKTNLRPSQSKTNSARSQAQIKRREHEKSSVRAKVEHVFGIVKRAAPLPKNTIPRFAKTDRKTEYDVCAGKLDLG